VRQSGGARHQPDGIHRLREIPPGPIELRIAGHWRAPSPRHGVAQAGDAHRHHVAGGFLSLSIAAPLAQSNAVRILGIASHGRVPTDPNLPTLTEQGIEGVEAELWFALMAPAGTPREIVARYNTAINEIVREPHVIDLAAKQGVAVRGGTPEQLAEFLVHDIATWRAVVKEAGIKAE
jgi:tripartite-type tricarboxylate transporter receptor subunit TctC